jgi:hypothetical protein
MPLLDLTLLVHMTTCWKSKGLATWRNSRFTRRKDERFFLRLTAFDPYCPKDGCREVKVGKGGVPNPSCTYEKTCDSLTLRNSMYFNIVPLVKLQAVAL